MPSFTIGVGQRRAAAALVLVVALVAVLARRHGPDATTLAVEPVRPAATGAPSAQRPIVVDVVGAVRSPGIYRLRDGARVADAVARAGGLARSAERSAVNFAAKVSDGQQVVVAARGSPAASGGGTSGAVSLSSATPEQLDALPGIGPVTAAKIVAYREEHGPFASVEALDAIPGIGPARIAQLEGLVVP